LDIFDISEQFIPVCFPFNKDAVRILDEQADGGVNKEPLFITVYMNVVSVYGREGECIPLRAWWLIGSSILAPLAYLRSIFIRDDFYKAK